MRFDTLASDYDGTLTLSETVETATIEALCRAKAAGMKLVLVTGRELRELFQVFPENDVCDRIVAENGGVIYHPETRETRLLSHPPPPKLVQVLREKGVTPLSVGNVLLATREPNEGFVLAAIRELGLEYHIIFNKGAVMVLPSTVNKATGLTAVLKEMNISSKQVAGIGDAENDHAFLELCGFSAAVANALPALKQRVDLVTASAAGEGVKQLLEKLLDQNAALEPKRHAPVPA